MGNFNLKSLFSDGLVLSDRFFKSNTVSGVTKVVGVAVLEYIIINYAKKLLLGFGAVYAIAYLSSVLISPGREVSE